LDRAAGSKKEEKEEVSDGSTINERIIAGHIYHTPDGVPVSTNPGYLPPRPGIALQ
jgi:hypothetical protein